MLGLALTTIGCGATAGQITRGTINGAATTVEQMEDAFFERFVVESDRCEAGAEDVAAYRACLGSWYTANVALQSATTALHLADSAYEGGLAAADGDWRDFLACAAESIATAVTALADLGVTWEDGAEVLTSIAEHGGACAEVER